MSPPCPRSTGCPDGLADPGRAPAAGRGNLIFSIAPAAGTDPYGNSYVAGAATYGASGVAQLAQGFEQLAPTVAQINNGFGSGIDGSGNGFLTMTSGVTGLSDTNGSLIITSKSAGGGSSQCSIECDSVTINDTASQPTPYPQTQVPLGSAPAAYSQSYTTGIMQRINTIITQLQATGVTQ